MWDIASNLPFNLIFAVILIISLLADVFRVMPNATVIFMTLSIIGVIPVALSAGKALFKRKMTIDLLASVALIFSFVAGEWHSAVFINLMLTFARVFSIWTDNRTKRIIEHLMKYRPETVKIKLGTEIIEKPVTAVHVGDLVVIEVGERVPVDGTVVYGAASIDESTLTGESEHVSKKIGSPVYSSTLNVSGSLIIRAEKVGEESTLAKIIALVEEASRSKAKTERVADRFAQWYITTMLFGSIALYLLLHNSALVLSILLVICADDIAVAVPLAFTVAIAYGARRGILIKGSSVIEKASRIQIFITDKTGTLTSGHPKIRDVKILGGQQRELILKYLGMASSNSSHPVNIATVAYIKDKKIAITAPDEFLESPGEGISVKAKNVSVDVGKIEFLVKRGAPLTPTVSVMINHYIEKGLSLSGLAVNHKIAALIIFDDEVKSQARSAIVRTKELGVRVWYMITGDNEKIAAKVARSAGIDSYESNVSPAEKLAYTKKIIEMQPKKEIVAMIGDGVNDAASLALADVSIAMGVIGSDAAIEAADIALMNDELARIPETMIIGKTTMHIVYQCFWIWVVSNGLGLLLVIFGFMNPERAAAYNFITDFFPIMNALSVGLRAHSQFIPRHS